VSVELVGLAILMAAVTYPSRAIPLLVPGFERLPAFVHAYLRLVGPAMLAALAAVGVLFTAGQPGIRIGVELIAVIACIAIVAWRGSLLIGLIVAVALVAMARGLGAA
jgi:branched-subunit amino acid transport protein